VVDNAFYHVNMGDNLYGVLGVAPTDPMHIFEDSMIRNLLEVVILPLPPDSARKRPDFIVESLFAKGSNCSAQRAQYPQIHFSGGYSSLTQLSVMRRLENFWHWLL
jgi:hypothetical protein